MISPCYMTRSSPGGGHPVFIRPHFMTCYVSYKAINSTWC